MTLGRQLDCKDRAIKDRAIKGGILKQQGSPATAICLWSSTVVYGRTVWGAQLTLPRVGHPHLRSEGHFQHVSACPTATRKRSRNAPVAIADGDSLAFTLNYRNDSTIRRTRNGRLRLDRRHGKRLRIIKPQPMI
ncbi:MAG: hypothetical protein ABSG53_08650 [Thermoguttaceae bacterium]